MAQNEKRFDAVRLMRSIRSELNEQVRGMTFAEEQAYTRERLRHGSTDNVSGAHVATALSRQAAEGEDQS